MSEITGTEEVLLNISGEDLIIENRCFRSWQLKMNVPDAVADACSFKKSCSLNV